MPKRGPQKDSARWELKLFSKLGVFIVLSTAFLQGQRTPESKLDYTVTFGDAAHHRVHVSMTYDPESGGREIALPVWNATYQVRDFARNVLDVKASGSAAERLALKQIDKTTWEFVPPRGGWATIDYDIVLGDAGPFGAQFNAHHAFFNLAEVLMYPTGGRELPITLHFDQVPANWKLATALPVLTVPPIQPGGLPGDVLHAANYDRLVDSPCELGEFTENDFEQGGANYRVVVDGNSADYDATKLTEAIRKITAAETAWMDDRPFDTYLFIYHFPRGFGGGGMEHAYSTAIDHSAADLKDLESLESTTAHEFFHLWNVKRIRPQSLEPIDYSRENYTRALWFSEGVTSTVADLTMLKAGLLTPPEFFQQLSEGISVLQSRSAHSNQSAEESSLDAWLEKYPNYHAPERSISYYNKGELLGILLDLKIRQDSHGRYSLRDLFQSMNRDYGKQNVFFPDSEGVRTEAENLTGTDLQSFFRQYVAGTDELPYDELLATVGLTLEKQNRMVADPGFSAIRNFSGPLIIDQVYGDQARAAGLHEGDEILALDGEQPGRNYERKIASLKPGAKVRVSVFTQGTHKDVDVTLGERSLTAYVLKDSPQPTPQQLARRRAWLESEDQATAKSN